MRRTQTAEVPALHGTGKALALRVPGNVDLLAGDEVISGDRGADGKETFLVLDPEFRDLHLQANFRLRESFALRLVDVLLFRFARTDLDGPIAVAIGGAVCGNLTPFQSENGHGHVPAILLKQAGHSDLLGDYASAHRKTPKQRHPGPSEVRDGPFFQTAPARVVMHRPSGLIALEVRRTAERETGDAARSKLRRYLYVPCGRRRTNKPA